jgi:hypothetical protein
VIRGYHVRLCSSFDASWTLPYRRELLGLETEATVNEAKFRQRGLLEDGDSKPFPQEIETKVLELLVQMLVAVIPAIDGGRRDEQDHQ